jgi:hypothetical protein
MARCLNDDFSPRLIPLLRESVLFALISYFTTRIGSILYQLIRALYLMA